MKYISYILFLLSHHFLLQLLQCSFGHTVHFLSWLLSPFCSWGLKSVEVFALLAIKVMKAGQICSPHVISAHLLFQTNWFLFFMLCWSYCPCSLRSVVLPPALLLCPTEPPALSSALSRALSSALSRALSSLHSGSPMPFLLSTSLSIAAGSPWCCVPPAGCCHSSSSWGTEHPAASAWCQRKVRRIPRDWKAGNQTKRSQVWILKSVWFLRPDVILESISDSSVLTAYIFAASCHPFSLLFLLNYAYYSAHFFCPFSAYACSSSSVLPRALCLFRALKPTFALIFQPLPVFHGPHWFCF